MRCSRSEGAAARPGRRIFLSKRKSRSTLLGITKLECGLCQIDILPLPTLDAGTNLCRRLPLLRLLVGVDRLLHAGRAGCSVGSFKAAMQAVMPQLTVAMAIAGLLMQHSRNCRRHLVGGHLIRMGEIDSRKLIAA